MLVSWFCLLKYIYNNKRLFLLKHFTFNNEQFPFWWSVSFLSNSFSLAGGVSEGGQSTWGGNNISIVSLPAPVCLLGVESGRILQCHLAVTFSLALAITPPFSMILSCRPGSKRRGFLKNPHFCLEIWKNLRLDFYIANVSLKDG